MNFLNAPLVSQTASPTAMTPTDGLPNRRCLQAPSVPPVALQRLGAICAPKLLFSNLRSQIHSVSRKHLFSSRPHVPDGTRRHHTRTRHQLTSKTPLWSSTSGTSSIWRIRRQAEPDERNSGRQERMKSIQEMGSKADRAKTVTAESENSSSRPSHRRG